MQKQEFEKLVGKEVSQETYDIIETVYMNYPSINDKHQIIDFYKQFGMVIIADLYPRAKKIHDRMDKISELSIEIRDLKECVKLNVG